MAHRLNAVRVILQINGEGLLQLLPGPEIPPVFGWIENADSAFQVALLADTIADACLRFRWIHNVMSCGGLHVRRPWTMASLAGNRRESRVLVTVAESARQSHAAGMAEQATGDNLMIEVQPALGFIARRQIPAVRARVVRNRRLEQVFAGAHQITAADDARSNVIRNSILRLEPGLLNSLSHPVCV